MYLLIMTGGKVREAIITEHLGLLMKTSTLRSFDKQLSVCNKKAGDSAGVNMKKQIS